MKPGVRVLRPREPKGAGVRESLSGGRSVRRGAVTFPSDFPGQAASRRSSLFPLGDAGGPNFSHDFPSTGRCGAGRISRWLEAPPRTRTGGLPGDACRLPGGWDRWAPRGDARGLPGGTDGLPGDGTGGLPGLQGRKKARDPGGDTEDAPGCPANWRTLALGKRRGRVTFR